MARRFFFVSAGLFLLALAYQLGAVSAHAQGNGTRVVGEHLAVSGGQLFELIGGVGWEPLTGSPVPPDQIASARSPSRGQLIAIITTSGEGWGWADAAGWVNYGPAPGSATPALRQSWGELKDRFK